MALLDVVIMILMAASAYTIYRGLGAEKLRLRVRGCGESLTVEGRSVEGYVLTVESDEGLSEAKASRVAEILRSMGVASLVVAAYIPLDKREALSRIEEEIKSVEFKYTATRMPKYRARLEFLRNLYMRVARSYVPVASTFHVVVLVSGDSKSIVETVRRSIEAELGVTVRVSRFKGLGDMVSNTLPSFGAPHSPPPAQPGEFSAASVVVGYRRGGGMAILKWPRDFESHVGVFGPTGKGKTVLLAGIAAQLASSAWGPQAVAVIDPKGDLAALLEGVADRIIDVDSPDTVPSPSSRCLGTPVRGGLEVFRLASAPERVRSRIAEAILEGIVDHALSGAPKGRIVVVVDEAWRIGESERLLRLIAREGRSRGLHLVYASQHPSDMPGDILSNTKAITLFGGSERSYLEAASSLGLPEDAVRELPRLGIGEAVLKVGSGRLEYVRVLGFHEYLNRPGREARVTGLVGGNGEKAKAAEGW